MVPAGYNPLGPLKGPREDGKYFEMPAKATGNDVFSEAPSVNDWFETVKLNYGVDYQNGRKAALRRPCPIPGRRCATSCVFWAGKNVDGFRCDMVEMVPVEFWAWVIPELKKVKPGLVFIGEAYNPKEYRTYLDKGNFDFLYDKVGLYDGLRKLMRQEGTTEDITKVWKEESNGFSSHMLRFLENHDEQRIASQGLCHRPAPRHSGHDRDGHPGQRPGDALLRAGSGRARPRRRRLQQRRRPHHHLRLLGRARAPEVAEPGQVRRRQAQPRAENAARLLPPPAEP